MIRIGVVVGEHSGDMLGSGLIHELKSNGVEVCAEGILGPELIKEGGHCLFPMEKLAVMGITEVFGKYLELVSIRNQIRNHFISNPPDVFIGIDAPDFNLDLEKQLRDKGIRTIHYVSPAVWAWRKNRIDKLVSAADSLLALYPFEPAYYKNKNIRVEYTGHPLADRIPITPDMKSARASLGLKGNDRIVALMPGSRTVELDRHLPVFMEAASLCAQHGADIKFLLCFRSDSLRRRYQPDLESRMPEIHLKVYAGNALRVMEASDVVLLASGTVALEAMLLKKPMVVAYRVNPLSYYILRWMLRLPYVSMPNILHGRMVVPEFLQNAMQPANMAEAIMNWLVSADRVRQLESDFTAMHYKLRNNADSKAASHVLQLCQ